MEMGKYEEKISDDSLWITATPTPPAKTLPFFISEAGHFIADSDYTTKRDMHDSFLLIYTISGQGSLKTGNTTVTLSHADVILIDCHIPHEYHTLSKNWEFLWIHFNGSGVIPLFDLIYPAHMIRSFNMDYNFEFEQKMTELIYNVRKNDVAASIGLSSDLHSLLNFVCLLALNNEKVNMEKRPSDDIRAVIDFIEDNYSLPVTIDDMIKNIHVSKYHFIRRFKRAMGVTPYSYLTNYRINISKTLLCTTGKTVSEIAETCGFSDTSNFITQFKKHTGQKPLQYRRYFSVY